ncbi:MAG TPA: hypothetical protein VM328_12210 [Fimbriimonadaceae bacterium]|nr:hypothetical protein [Fimbriimonadaceae bacterium]
MRYLLTLAACATLFAVCGCTKEEEPPPIGEVVTAPGGEGQAQGSNKMGGPAERSVD